MKILVLSLLRLGDFLQTVPALSGLKTQFPVKRLDVLTFEPPRALHPMLKDVDQWWTLNRDELQAGLGRADLPMLTSFSVLRERLDQISAVGYDCIVNLTHTEFSGWIAGYLESKRRLGLSMDADGRPNIHSPWFQYLNDHAGSGAKDMFHYIDIFFHGCGLRGSERIWRLRETEFGKSEAKPYTSAETVVLQLFTSDVKKNWPESSWLWLMKQLKLLRPRTQFVLLCAPNEIERARPVFDSARAAGVNAELASLSLEGAFSLLKNSRLLITGDTSIKHLANAARTQILELSLGSSDFRRTGAYSPDSLILQPRIGCAPCPHSSGCSRPSHECAEGLGPELVAAAAHHLIAGDWMAIGRLASEYLNEVALLRTMMMGGGYWMAADLCETQPRAALESLVERSTWAFLLNQEHQKTVPQFGSEGVKLAAELGRLLPRENPARINEHLNFIEHATGSRHTRAVLDRETFSRETPRTGSDGVVEIGSWRRENRKTERSEQLNEIKLKLIRALKSQLTENR